MKNYKTFSLLTVLVSFFAFSNPAYAQLVIPTAKDCDTITNQYELVCLDSNIKDFISSYFEENKFNIETTHIQLSFDISKQGIFKNIEMECNPEAYTSYFKRLFKKLSRELLFVPAVLNGKNIDSKVQSNLILAFDTLVFRSNYYFDLNLLNENIDQEARLDLCEHLESESERKICAERELLDFIYNYISLLRDDRMQTLEGAVELIYKVDREGKIRDVICLRDEVFFGAFELVKKILQHAPKFIPANNKGNNIDSWKKLKIRFVE